MENKEWKRAVMREPSGGTRSRPWLLIAYGLSLVKKSALLKMTAEEKRAGGFLPPEREARHVINNQDEGTGAVEALLLFTEPGHKRKSVIL